MSLLLGSLSKFPATQHSKNMKLTKAGARHEALTFYTYALEIIFEEIDRRETVTREDLLTLAIEIGRRELNRVGKDVEGSNSDVEFVEKKTPKKRIRPQIVPGAPKKARKEIEILECKEELSN